MSVQAVGAGPLDWVKPKTDDGAAEPRPASRTTAAPGTAKAEKLEADHSHFRAPPAQRTLKGANQQFAQHQAEVRKAAQVEDEEVEQEDAARDDAQRAAVREEPSRAEVRAYREALDRHEDGRPGRAFKAEL